MASYLGLPGRYHSAPWRKASGWVSCSLPDFWVGNIINGLTIAAGLIIRLVAVRANKENEQTLNILGAGALAGAAIYSFFTATLGLVGKKD